MKIHEHALIWAVVAVSFLIGVYMITSTIDCAFDQVNEAIQKAVNPHGGLN